MYNRYESSKFRRRMQRRKERIATKRMKTYKSDTDPSTRLKKPFKNVVIFISIMFMCFGLYTTVYLLVYRVIVDLSLYMIEIAVFIIGPIFIMLYVQSHAASERTFHVIFGDKSPHPANDHSKGKYHIVHNFEYTNPKDPSLTLQHKKRIFEVGKIGDLKGAWPEKVDPIIWLAPVQFGDEDNGSDPKYAGYTNGGGCYIIPVKPEQMRFRTFERIYKDLALQLQQINGIGGHIRPRTKIWYSFEPVSVPEGIPQGGDSFREMYIWDLQGRINKITGQVHEFASDDDITDSFDRKY
jgi:NADH:ubiquinone oxidoreductase subunit 3 (subunit A)